jgi:hypothetical protein
VAGAVRAAGAVAIMTKPKLGSAINSSALPQARSAAAMSPRRQSSSASALLLVAVSLCASPNKFCRIASASCPSQSDLTARRHDGREVPWHIGRQGLGLQSKTTGQRDGHQRHNLHNLSNQKKDI